MPGRSIYSAHVYASATFALGRASTRSQPEPVPRITPNPHRPKGGWCSLRAQAPFAVATEAAHQQSS